MKRRVKVFPLYLRAVVSPAERWELKSRAATERLSLTDFVRRELGLPPLVADAQETSRSQGRSAI